MEACPARPVLKSFVTSEAVIVASGASFVITPLGSSPPSTDQALWSDGEPIFYSDFTPAYWAN